MSLSARRAWIEIQVGNRRLTRLIVALRKESVDRNNGAFVTFQHPAVALRKESVDRNICPTRLRPTGATSLSARRAWIEITKS